MDLFCDLTFTIALSLLLPLLFIKLLSFTTNFDTNNEKVYGVGLDRDHDRDHDREVKSDSHNWVTEEDVQIVRKVDEFREKSVQEKHIAAEKVVDVNWESHKILNSEKIDDNHEIEVANLAENPAEEVEVESMECDHRANEVEEIEILQCDRNCDEIDEYKRNVEVDENMCLLGEDEWEGIERSELEKCFGAAVVFVGSKSYANRLSDLSNDVKLKLYGYHRIATHGPCTEPKPMALNFSARAKWNAWHQLGNMRPELAMDRYISLLSESVPDWMPNYPYENVQLASANTGAFAKPT